MKTYKIHLIRHGLAEGSEDGKYIGQTDVPLTIDGKKQLKDMLHDFQYPEVDAVICSPLDRCLETAKILYPDKNPIIFDDLIEYDFGEFEGQTADELKTDPAFGEWLAGGEDAGCPYGETNAEFKKRICKCFEGIIEGVMKTGVSSVAIITHGGVIMSLMQYYAFPELPMHEWLMPAGCGYTLNVDHIIWNNVKRAETFAEVPIRPFEPEEEEEDIADLDKDFDPSEFVGFYSPEEDTNGNKKTDRQD